MTKIDFIGKCLLLRSKSKKTGKEKKIVVIGDLHLGYEEALNKTGVFVTREMFKEMISELDRVFERVEREYGKGRMDEVVLLGDVKHVFGSVLQQEWGEVLRLFDYLLEKGKKIIIVKGNHDAILEPIVKKRENVQLEDFYIEHEVVFLHGDGDYGQIWDKEIDIVILGHIHPAVKLRDKGGVRIEKYKCFLDGLFKDKRFIFMPSFSNYSEGSDPRDEKMEIPFEIDFEKFEVRVVESKDLEVLNFGKLGKLK